MMRYALSHSAMRSLAALLVLFPPSVQAADPVPGAGTILQQIQPVTRPSPSSTGTDVRIEREGSGELPPSAPFEVKILRITGHTRFDTATLHALVAEAEGKSRTLAQLAEIAARITDYYRGHGYPLARAIIPAQVIRDGVVDIQVIEARYGGIRLDNRSAVTDSLLQDTISSLEAGQVISQRELDHALLLLSDVPGIAVSATLGPGETFGTSDLLVEAATGAAVTGNVALDDYGNRFTGRARIGATLNFINPLHHGDVLSASGVSSGRGMSYGRLAYESLLNGWGTRLSASYAELHYDLGGSLASLNAHGTAQVESIWAKHPLLRSRNVNLYGQIQYERMKLRDHIDSSAIRTDRTVTNWTASLFGDAPDTFLSGGVNSWSVGWTTGRVTFDDAAAQLADAATAGTGAGFSKWNASLARLQLLSPRNTLYLAIVGQWANDNLDPSRKMTAGGPYAVRAYDVGAISGDTGYVGTVELRHDLESGGHGRWKALAFVDSAHVKVNRNPWVATDNRATLGGAGVGLDWAGPDLWSARVHIATTIGSTPVLVANTASTRAWVEVSKGF